MATSHKLMQEITDQFLHCKICLEPYREPKTLTCLHTFCSPCIQQHVDSENTRSRYSLYNRHVTCPLCRKKTEIPTGGVRRLPDNFLLANLTEVIDRRRPLKIPPCEICHTVRPRSNDACSKCLDCSKLLCKTCVELHMTTKVTQTHSLIDVEGEKDIECKVHPDEIVRFYCEPCDTCICVVCTFQEHRDHEICSFSDGYVKYKSSLESLLHACKNRHEVVQERINVMNQCETILKETRESIRDLAISYIQQVRSTEKELLKEVDSYFGENIMNFLENKDWLQENLDGLQNACNLTDIIMRDKGVEMLLLKREMENKLNSLLEPCLPDLPDDVTTFATKVKFIPGDVKFGKLTLNDNNDNQTDFSMENKRCSFGCQVEDFETNDLKSSNCSNKEICETGKGDEQTKKTSERKRSIAAPTVDACMQTFSDIGSKESGICVKCCQDLQSEINIASSNFNSAPCVQDVIVLDTKETNPKEWRRRRRSLIRSRRVQTDLSMSNEELDEMSLSVPNLRHIPGRSYSYDAVSTMCKPETKTVALDPILIECNATKSTKTRDKITMTSVEMKPVVPTRNAITCTHPPRTRDFNIQTKIESRNSDTQTPTTLKNNKNVGTDYAGQRDKTTTTIKVTTIDSETTMPTTTQSTVATWTDAMSTTERAMCTDCCETSDSFTEMTRVTFNDQGLQVRPEQRDINTSTLPPKVVNLSVQTEQFDQGQTSENRKSWQGGFLSKLFRSKGSGDSKGSNDKLCSHPDLTDLLPPPSPTITVDASTETLTVMSCDKETGTVVTTSCDQWTETPTPILINTGISPARPATMESSCETNPVISMDQSTHTEVVTLKDSTTETTLSVQDNETLTEKLKSHDAQTYVEISTITADTNTEVKLFSDCNVGTDDGWLEKIKSESVTSIGKNVNTSHKSTHVGLEEFIHLVDTATNPIPPEVQERGTMAISIGQSSIMFSDMETQTSEVNLYDKSVATSMELEQRPIECCDMATSTESLPYIGLLSELDGDELFLIPESAFDLVPSEPSIDENGEPIEMVDEFTSTDVEPFTEISTQTLLMPVAHDTEEDEQEVWKHSLRKDKDGKELIDVCTNTVQKITFEKETSTPIRHLFSKGTMTFYIAKSDKSTSTFSSSRQIAENVFSGKNTICDKANKLTNTPSVDHADVSTSTDPSMLTDGKMAACISKLQKVSERLQSPTRKTIPDVPWNSASKDQITNKNVSKVEGRKPQPITTLKGKTLSPPEEETAKSKSLPRDGEDINTSQPGSPYNSSKLPRYNSAPGKITTVPNQSLKYKNINTQQKRSPSKIPVHKGSNTSLDQVPVVRPKHPKVPTITTSRPTSSESDSTSFVSCTSDLSFVSNDMKTEDSGSSMSHNNSPVSFSKDKEAIEIQENSPTPSDKKVGSNVGFMQKLFSKKKKCPEPVKSTPQSPVKPRKFPKAEPPPPEPPKPQKPRPFVYIRQRYFSIQHDNEDEKPKHSPAAPEEAAVKKKDPVPGSTTPKSAPKRTHSNRKSRPKSKSKESLNKKDGEESRPVSTYDNL